MKLKRKVELVVVSDVYLGTKQCHAKQLLTYLNSIAPKQLILNGDIIDIQKLKKNQFPKLHLQVLKKILSFAYNGTKVTYITGDRDGYLSRFSNSQMGNISIVEKLVLTLDEKKAWFFHGGIFNSASQTTKWFAKRGYYGFEILLLINRLKSWFLYKLVRERFLLSQKINSNVKKDEKRNRNFEQFVTDICIRKNYDYVICGHLRVPEMIEKSNKKGKILYLNSGDWIENFTALEYQFKRWKIYDYKVDKRVRLFTDQEIKNLKMKDLIAAIMVLNPEKLKKKKPSN